MNLVEGQWKPLEQERVQVRQVKKWFFGNDKINRFANENISMRQ
jgi:hypothetical protein